MNLDEIHEKYYDMLKSIYLLKKNDFPESVLILLYSTLDSLSWLNSDNIDINKRNVQNDYIAFLEKYYIKHLNIDVTANEIYSARCSIVHTLSAKSKAKNTRILIYSNKYEAANVSNNFFKNIGYSNQFVSVDTINMLEALKKAIDDFFNTIKNDSNKLKNVMRKAENYYSLYGDKNGK